MSPTATTPRLGLPAPALSDPADVPADLDLLRDTIDSLTAVFGQGLANARPPAGIAGRFYFASDTKVLSYDDGQIWQTATGATPGDLKPSAAAAAPAGWLLCDGALYPRSGATAALFTVIGTTYGAGDGSSTFAVPDLRGRAPIGAGQGAGLANRLLGATGGEEAHTLANGEMPSHAHGGATGAATSGVDSPDHAHAISDPTHVHGGPSGYGIVGSVSGVAKGVFNPSGGTGLIQGNGAFTTGSTAAAATGITGTQGANARHAHGVPPLGIAADGGGGGHNNMPPFTAVNWLIKT